MKIYPKTFRDFFNRDKALNKINEERLEIDYESRWQYIEDTARLYKEYQRARFDFLVKALWLRNKMTFSGARFKRGQNGYIKDLAMKVFLNTYVGFDESTFCTSTQDEVLVSYIEELFPQLDKLDPFKIKVKYPFEHMNVEHLLLVNEMPERLELLLHGEKKKMGFVCFVNFVVNYLLSFNEEHGDTYTIHKKRWKRNYIHVRRVKLL